MKKNREKKGGFLELLLKIIVPVVISGGLCWLLFRDFNFHEMWRLIADECNFSWMILVLIISIISHIIRAMRWQIQLRALGVEPPLFYIVLSIFGTYAVNLVFPRLGEIWRTGYIAKRQDARFSTVFGSMVADRVADTLTVLLLLIIAFMAASESISDYLSQNGNIGEEIIRIATSPILWILLIAVAIIGYKVMTARHPKGFIIRIREALKGLWQGFTVVISMPGRGRWLALTVALWGCYFLQFYLAFFSFEFTSELLKHYGIMPALLGFVLSSASMGVPSNGGIGPWQWAVIFALGIYGLGGAQAGAFANVVLGCNTLLVIALGLFTFSIIAIGKRKQRQSSISINNKIT